VKRVLFLCLLLSAPLACFAQETSTRQDTYYDSERNVFFSIANVDADYGTQYYYLFNMWTLINNGGVWVPGGGVTNQGAGPISTYIEYPASEGTEFVAVTNTWLVTWYYTYDVIYPCDPVCDTYYDAFGYLNVADRDDEPINIGYTICIHVWDVLEPTFVVFVDVSAVFLGAVWTSQRSSQPTEYFQQFRVTYDSYVQAEWIDNPNYAQWCYNFTDSNFYQYILKGDNRSTSENSFANTYRFKAMAVLNPAASSAFTFGLPNLGEGASPWTPGVSREYVYPSGVDANGHLLDDYPFLYDCYKLDKIGIGDTSHLYWEYSHNPAIPSSTAHFFGGMALPEEMTWAPENNFDITVEITASDPYHPRYRITADHDCWPAHEVYIGPYRVTNYPDPPYFPLSNNPVSIAACLFGVGHIGSYVNSGPVP
jgi:hypothetical protein